MSGTFSGDLLSWLLTYAVHSTALLGAAWLITRARRLMPAASEIIWKSALIGGLFTASLQLWLDLRPAGSVALGTQQQYISVPPAPVTRSVGFENVQAPSVDLPVGIAPPAIEASSSASSWSMPSKGEAALVAWIVIAAVLATAYAARRLILIGRLGDRARLTDGPLPDMLATLAKTAGVREPFLTVTTRISSPVALGMREICLPESALTELSAEQQRSMLAHELAHVARHDPLWLVVSFAVERVFWFQPLNRIARTEIATAAEYLSDDWAVRRTGSGVPLAECLARVAEWIQMSPLGVPVSGMAEERSLLVTRVARLLENRMPTMTKRRVVALSAFAVLLATVVLVPTVAGRPVTAVSADSSTSLGMTPRADSSTSLGMTPSANASTSLGMAAAGEGRRVLTPGDSAVVIALIARLKDEDVEVRKAAAEALAKLEDARAVPGLVDAMKDANAEVRVAAAEALAQFKDRRAVPALENALSDQSVEVQKHAIEALSNFTEVGGIQSGPIVKLLDGKHHDEVVHSAIHLLAELKDRSTAPAIRAQLNSSNSDVRQAAIQALTELKDSESSGLISQKLSDSNSDVRNAALSAMEELRVGLSDPVMVALLKDRDADVRQRAAQLAGERQMVGVVSTLAALVEDNDSDVRVSAVQALANIADNSAQAALKKALSSKDAKVRRAVVEALGDRRP